ncbi:MAG: preprotein translocase subunit SecE [Elainellaceae cyanobacterium]
MSKKSEANVQDTKKSEFNAVEFLRGTKEELDKVVWPSRQQLISESLAVILMVALSASIIYLADQLFSFGADQVFR